MNDLSCCFTGHRANKLPWGFEDNNPACVELKQKIEQAVSQLYSRGVRHFICGMANGCDLYCAEAVLKLKKEHPELTLEAAVPHPHQASQYPPAQKQQYKRVLSLCDRITMIHKIYSRTCMMDRNRYMVDHSDIVLAIYNGSPGGTRNTILYALRSKKELIQIDI